MLIHLSQGPNEILLGPIVDHGLMFNTVNIYTPIFRFTNVVTASRMNAH